MYRKLYAAEADLGLDGGTDSPWEGSTARRFLSVPEDRCSSSARSKPSGELPLSSELVMLVPRAALSGAEVLSGKGDLEDHG